MGIYLRFFNNTYSSISKLYTIFVLYKSKNTTTMKKTLYFSVIIFLLASCSPAYVPSVVNSPLLNNQGQIQGRISSGTSGYDIQTAGALTDNIGVMVNGSFVNRTSDSTDNYRKHNYLEGAVGVYQPFGVAGRLEIYTGYGYGETEGFYSNALWGDFNQATYHKIFIQPGIGTSTSFVDFSFVPRIAFINLAKKGQQGISSYKPFFEPAVDMKFGYEFLKMFLQFGFAIPLTEQPGFNYQFFQFSVGLQVDLFNKSHILSNKAEKQ